MPVAHSQVSTTDPTPVHLHVETFGSPDDPTLLFVNGLGSQCINFRSEWMEMFVAEGFHVVRFDNRDVGLSSSVEAPYCCPTWGATPSPSSTNWVSNVPTLSACRSAG